MNWYIGQRIVAVTNSSVWRKGDEFAIIGIKQGFCCNKGVLLMINIGVTKWDATECKCGNKDNGLWFMDKCFAPLDTLPDLSELTDEMILTAPTTKELQTA